MKFNTRSLKNRMTVVVILLVLMATGIVAFTSLYIVERRMHMVIGEQQVALLSSAAAYIDQDLEAKQTLLRAVAEHIPPHILSHPELVQEFIEGHATLRDEFFNVGVFDRAGLLIGNLNDRRQLGKLRSANRAYFQDTLKKQEGLVSAPFKSALSGKPVVLVTQPIIDAGGKIVYIMAGGIDLQKPRFFGQLGVLRPGKSGYLFMITTDGVIIDHPEKARILKRVSEEPGGFVPSTLAAMGDYEGWGEAKSERGVPAIVSYKRLRVADWIIGAVYPTDEAFAAVTATGHTAFVASAIVALSAGILAWYAIRRLLKPLDALRRHVVCIQGGSQDIDVFQVERPDEFGDLSRAFYALSLQRREAESQLTALAHTDPLTGIGNRRKFDEGLRLAIDRSCRTGNWMALAFLDIDRFKSINDTYGHDNGDRVLLEFARRLVAAVRTTDGVYRLAGDEFMIIFENVNDKKEAALLGQKILDAVRSDFAIGEIGLQVSTSVGIVLSHGRDNSPDELVKLADLALYEAKNNGRNGFVVKA